MIRLLIAAVSLASFLTGGTTPSQAQEDSGPRVIIAAPGTVEKDALARQLQTLLVAECRSAGFIPIARTSRAPIVPLHEVEQHVVDTETAVAVVLVKQERRWNVEVWQMDRQAGKTVVRRLDNDRFSGSRRPADLAFRVVDLLRGALMGGIPADPAPVIVAAPVAPIVLEPTRSGWGNGLSFGLGVAALHNPSTNDPSLSAALEGTYVSAMGLGLRLLATVPVSDARVSAPEGSATVTRAAGLVGPLMVFRRDERVRPFVEFAIGAHRTHVRGRGVSDLFVASTESVLGFVAALGGGTAFALGDRFAVVIEAQMWLVTPPTRLHIVDREVKNLGGFALFGGVWLAAAL